MRLLFADSVPDAFIVSLLAFLFLISTVGLLMLRHKNRLIWSELFHIREEFATTRQSILEIRRQIVIEKESDCMRLAPLMPSQYGEDILLWNFFDHRREGFYVEVGAYDGIGFSNSYFFEAVGWTGLLVEAAPEACQACRSSRPHSQVINAAVGKGDKGKHVTFSVAEGSTGVGTLSFSGENAHQMERIRKEGGRIRTIDIPSISLDELLKDHEGEIDFVSIDVEGSEMDALKGFDLGKFRPRVLVVEDNSNGADREVGAWLLLQGYVERFRCEHNVFYTRRNDEGKFRW